MGKNVEEYDNDEDFEDEDQQEEFIYKKWGTSSKEKSSRTFIMNAPLLKENFISPNVMQTANRTNTTNSSSANLVDPWFYNFTIFFPFHIGFGLLHGALNTLPVGGNLSACGINSRA